MNFEGGESDKGLKNVFTLPMTEHIMLAASISIAHIHSNEDLLILMTSSMKKFMKKSSKPFQVIKGKTSFVIKVPLKSGQKGQLRSEKMTILQSILVDSTMAFL